MPFRHLDNKYSEYGTTKIAISMSNNSIGPEFVFTPRSPEVNTTTYIRRPELEGSLETALRTGQHMLICGQSGSGKTWLYRFVFPEVNTHFEMINLASLSATSFETTFRRVEGRSNPMAKTSRKEKKQVRGSAFVAHGQLETESTFELAEQCHYFNCLKQMHIKGQKHRYRCLVFDNLEAIVSNDKLMKELADYLILSDDPNYARFNVRILIVGVPYGIREYFRKISNMESVANRLREIPEVTRLRFPAVDTLVSRGFDALNLKYDPSIRSKIVEHIYFVTDGLAQRIHEYCFELADQATKSRGVISLQNLLIADRRWLRSSLMQAYETVISSMNKRKKDTGKRNQVLFALGQIAWDEFSVHDVNDAVFSAFYALSHGAIKFDSSKSLRELTSSNNPILQVTSNSGSYRFVDPRYRMAIRACLRKAPPLGVIAIEPDAI